MAAARAPAKSDKKKTLSTAEREALLKTLRARFENNMARHQGLAWAKVAARLEIQPDKLWSLQQMETTGGEPDVIAFDESTGAFIFYDCADQSPAGRRSICYDRAALEARKEHKPKSSAMDLANMMGVEMLSEEEYRHLQTLGTFDTKTQSWIKTPPDLRSLGGALFCDRRFNRVFVYHNTAECYFAGRGFRAVLRV